MSRRDDPDHVLGQAERRARTRSGARAAPGCVVHTVELAGHLVEVGDRPAGLQRRRVRPRVEHVLGDDHVGARRTPRRWPPCRRPPSRRCGCRPCPRCRRGSPGRPGSSALRGVDHRRAAARTRRRSARARRAPSTGPRRRRTRPPVPGSGPCRWPAPPARPGTASASRPARVVSSVSPVMTALTLGCASAAEVSIETILACASGLRRIAPCSMPGKLDVVDEGALAADEARVLLALRAGPIRRSGSWPAAAWLGHSSGHPRSPPLLAASCSARPAAPTARCSRSRCSGRSARTAPRGSPPRMGPGCGRAATGRSSSCPGCRSRTAARGISVKPCWTGSRPAVAARSSTVRTRCPSAMAASTVHDFTGVSSSQTTQAPQFEVSQPQCEPVSPRSSRRKWMSSSRGSTSRVYRRR